MEQTNNQSLSEMKKAEKVYSDHANVGGSKIWAFSERTNETIEKIMWYTDSVMLPKFYL